MKIIQVDFKRKERQKSKRQLLVEHFVRNEALYTILFSIVMFVLIIGAAIHESNPL